MFSWNSTNTSLPDGKYSTYQNITNSTMLNETLIETITQNLTSIMDNSTSAVGGSSGICSRSANHGVIAVKTLVYIIVILITLTCNSLIVSVIVTNKRMQTPVNFFILNMAISDLLIALFFMPRMFSRIFYGIAWQIPGLAGLILCKISASMQEFCASLSVFLFMAIAVDRFLAVVFPLKKIITKNVAIVIVILIWVVTLVIRIPTFYGFKLHQYGSSYYCLMTLEDPLANEIYKNLSFVVFYAVPLCIVVVLYSAVIVALKKRKRPGASSQTQQNNQLKRTHRILKMLVTVVVSFSLLWFLYFCLPVLTNYMPWDISCNLFFPMFFFSHVNCAFNPMVYLIFIENYRVGVIKILKKCCPKGFCKRSVSPYDERCTSEVTMRNVSRARSSTADLEKSYASNDCPV